MKTLKQFQEGLVANIARLAATATIAGLGGKTIYDMTKKKKKMDQDGQFTPGSTMDNIQKKNEMLKNFNTGNY